MSPRVRKKLWDLGLSAIKELEVDRGILASGKNEIYGCIFGRDSLITSLKLLGAYEKTKSPYFLDLVKKILINLAELQGKEFNIESGEQPGKMIHEYRPTNHERLTKALANPWYVYPDGTMRNYDSVDATPLFLMAVHAYLLASSDEATVSGLLTHVRAALAWLLLYADSNMDGFIDYRLDPARTFGGLMTQSWMDSVESVFFERSEEKPAYPIAPVEAQAYAWQALRAWSDYFKEKDPAFATKLRGRADALKTRFNAHFVLHGKTTSIAFALDGKGRPLTSRRSSMGHCLFAAWRNESGFMESIIDARYVPAVVQRLVAKDLYVRSAGIRTLSSRSTHFDPNSYHNGSIWPHDTTIVAQGFEHFGYIKEAKQVRSSILKAYYYFESPIELFVYAQRKYGEYMGPGGQEACKMQAWSAASLLTMLGGEEE